MGVPLAIIGAGVSIGSTVLRTKAQADAANAEAERDEYNASLTDRAAADATARGEVSAGRAKMQAGAQVGAQKTSYAAAGVSTTSGSALDVMSDTAALGALDASIATNNAAREAFGFKGQALNFRMAAVAARKRASAAVVNGVLSGISGAASYGMDFLSLGKKPPVDAGAAEVAPAYGP